MSSSTLSSTSGLSDRISNSKRALSDNEELDERTIKRTRTAPDDQHNGKRDAKEKKKRQKKKKKKHSVVTVEDGRARVKDSRRGVSSFLDTTDVEDMILPVKAGESSTTLSKISVPTTGSMDSLLEEHDVEQIVSFSKDKGKGKATDPPQPEAKAQPGPSRSESAEEQVARLTKELSFKNELIEQHQSAFSHVQQTITCQVCLELMHKPYALSPCGHLACYDCLVSWFKAPPPDDRAVPPPVTLRKKTCPHCRAVVKNRPVQIWSIKSIVSNFSKSGLLQGTFVTPDESTQNANDKADPWNGIFPKISHVSGHDNMGYMTGAMGGSGIEDDEDGVMRCYDCMHEIWDGVCSNCGREYRDPDEYDDFSWGPDFGSEEEDFHHGFGWGVHRGMGAARNVDLDQHDLAAWAAANARAPGPVRLPSETLSDDEREEGYESSFIDDENDVSLPRGNLRREPVVIDITSESEEEEEPVRRRPSSVRRGTRPLVDPIEISDEDEGVQQVRRLTRSRGGHFRRRSGPLGAGSIVILSGGSDASSSGSSVRRASNSRRSNRTRSRTVLTDEDNGSDNDSDTVDPDLAERVAAQERELYGDDGSIPRRREHRDDDIRHFSIDETSDLDDMSGYYDGRSAHGYGSGPEDLFSW